MTNKRFSGIFLFACILSLSAAFSACNVSTASSSESESPVPESTTPVESSKVDSYDEPQSSVSEASSDTTDSSDDEIPVEQPTQTSYTQYIRCTADKVNIRAGTGTNSQILGIAEKDTVYAVISKTNNRYKIYYKNHIAYLPVSYAAVFSIKNSPVAETENVLAEAYKLIGTPYVYGAVRLHDGKGNFLKGFTSQKFDCSSLVQYVFYKGAGTLLQVTTRTQFSQGTKVAKSDLQRGDCLYFTNEQRRYNVGIERVGHVAVYLGENYILHTASDYARIEQISSARWKFFLEGRRFL